MRHSASMSSNQTVYKFHSKYRACDIPDITPQSAMRLPVGMCVQITKPIGWGPDSQYQHSWPLAVHQSPLLSWWCHAMKALSILLILWEVTCKPVFAINLVSAWKLLDKLLSGLPF